MELARHGLGHWGVWGYRAGRGVSGFGFAWLRAAFQAHILAQTHAR